MTDLPDNVVEAIARSLAESLVRSGEVDASLDPVLLQEEVARKMTEFVGQEVEWTVQVDYKQSLLEEARRFATLGKLNFAIMFYATWLEHWANSMIIWSAQRRGLTEAESVRIVRESSFPSKFSTMWRLCIESPLDQETVATVSNLASERNAFVHYKWRSEPADADSPKIRQVALVAQAEETIARLEALENELIFGGNREKVLPPRGVRPEDES